MDKSISSVPIRTPKLKQHSPGQYLGELRLLTDSRRDTARGGLVNVWYHKVFKFVNKSLGYYSKEVIPSAEDPNWDSKSPDVEAIQPNNLLTIYHKRYIA